jgi:aldose 1-epimerase
MSFSAFTKHQKGFQQLVLLNEANGTEIVILPEHGASLHSFSINTDKGPVNCIDHYKDAQELDELLYDSHKSSKLSPFPCRISNGKYNFEGKQFEFRNKFHDGSAIHGLLYNRHFSTIEKSSTDENASASFEYHFEKEDEGFPFRYICRVNYTLFAENRLQVETIITNTDAHSIPMADGWHPYFTLEGKVDDWVLQSGVESTLEFNDKLIPTGRLLPDNKFQESLSLKEIQLDNCFVVTDFQKAACRLSNPSNKLSLEFFPTASYRYLQIYTPPHRNSIAIENLSAPPDSFNNKMDLVVLAPGESKNFTVSYQLNCD